MVDVTLLPRSRPLTREDLEALPDDGHRYELIDGALIVTPAPSTRHQRVVGNLYLALRAGCPDDLEVFFAPFEVALGPDTVVQPDLLVTRRDQLTARGLPVAPLLAVEVLSPSTRHIDLSLKRARYEAAACASYWVIDPDAPSLTAWDLRDGGYLEAAFVQAEETFSLSTPYPVSIVPALLIV